MNASAPIVRGLPLCLLLPLATILLPACGSSTQQAEARGAASSDAYRDGSRFDDQGMLVRRYDLNGDDVPDVWKIFRKVGSGDQELLLVRKEIDVNFDHHVDVWQYYDEKGQLVKDEMDLNFDGRIDVVTYYQGGQVVRREVNSEFDGRPDIKKYYEDGVIVRLERDSDHDGRVDVWEYYEGGVLDRVMIDEDKDGKADTVQQAMR